ncbi:AraC family transcriptional regulator [Pseudomonas sp. MPC6]|uniref:AraC family transcriptional regulator n=1 Tax=unclassified Pseudomonas TaxID=196821 RepID=UPI001110E828|nr:AraC family transcriptional regulator [Pseudomonas sp. MPC6]QCY09434.1 AraC family transcriptional regulator [Pseudomonas sp. MPC6]
MNPTPSIGIPMIRAAAAVDVAALIRRQGLDPETVFEKADIDLKIIQDPYQKIRLDRFTYLLELAADITLSPHFGLTMGINQDPAKWGAFGYLVLNSPTIGAALRNLATFLKPWQSGTHIACIRDSRIFGIEYSILHPGVVHKSQDAEVSLAYVKNIVDRLCEKRVSPVAVHFEHSPISELSVYKKLYGVTPYFDQPVNCITFPLPLEDKPVLSADLQLFPVLRQHLVDMANAQPDSNDLVGSVTYQIRQFLPLRQSNLKNVAAALAIESRTLQRHLKAQKFVFTQMVEEMRQEQATEHLGNSTMELKEISHLLGYSDTSAFIKAFRKWTGESPGQYRENRKG